MVQPVVTYRKNVPQPGCPCPTQAQSLPIPMHPEMPVQQVRNGHVLHLRYQNRKVINLFCRYGKRAIHAYSLPHFLNLVKK
jgi:hypothetical protein